MSDALEQDDEQPALVEQLHELLRTPGWKWFCQQVEAEFGPSGIARRLNTIRAEIPRGPGREFDLTAKLDALYEAADVVNTLIAKPKATLQKLTAEKPTRMFEQFRRTVGTHK